MHYFKNLYILKLSNNVQVNNNMMIVKLWQTIVQKKRSVDEQQTVFLRNTFISREIK